ncbi:MAG: NTP transferase domain-containing protein [Pseudomonadota bacterium]
MKAIVLAAGQGTRLRPLTDDRPKCLVEVAGKTILEHIVRALRSAGVDDITVVTGYRADQIQRYQLATRHNERYATTNMVYSLFCAEDLLVDDDVLVVYGDIVFHPDAVKRLIAEPAGVSIAVNTNWLEVWQVRMEDPLSDAETLRVDESNHIVDIGNKAGSLEEIEGQYMGLMLFRAHQLSAIRAMYHELRDAGDTTRFDNLMMTDFLQLIRDRVAPLQAVFVPGGWIEVDSVEDREAYLNHPESLAFIERF